MDRIRELCYNLGNCTLVVYLSEVSVVTCYKIDTFNLLTPNPSGAARISGRKFLPLILVLSEQKFRRNFCESKD